MTRSRLTHVMVVFLGLLYVAAGIAETVRLVRSGDGGFAFWFGSLVGGGSLVLAGEALRHRHRRLSTALIGGGAVAGVLATAWTLVVPVAGVLATAWTLVVPVLAVVTAVLALARMEDEAAPTEPTATGLPPGSDAP